MKKSSLVLILFSVLVFVPGFAQAKVTVVATLPSFADIASEVGGEDVSVTALTRGTQDPHFVDARPDLVLKLNRADLIIHAGLGLEDGWLPPLLTGARNGKIQLGSAGNLNASTVIDLKDRDFGNNDRSAGDVHPGGNPHYMLDPRNGIRVAQAIADKLAALDGEKSAPYSKRAGAYIAKLKERIAVWEKTYKPRLTGQPIVTYHRSWLYLTEWMGMRTAGHVEPKPGIPPSPSHVVTLVGQMKQGKVKLLVMEPYYPRGVNEDVAKQAGAKLLVLPAEVNGSPEAKTYLELFEIILHALGQALVSS